MTRMKKRKVKEIVKQKLKEEKTTMFLQKRKNEDYCATFVNINPTQNFRSQLLMKLNHKGSRLRF